MFKNKIVTIIILLLVVGILYLQKNDFLNKKQQTQEELKNEKIVNIYSSRKEELMRDLIDNFEKTTNIKVNLITDKAGKLISRLESEGTISPADILLTSDIGNLYRAKEKDLLQPVNSEILNANIPQKYRDKDGTWYGLSKRVRAIFYAKDRVNIADLSTYEDLANEKWQGKILIRSSNNIYNQSLLSSIINATSEETALNWVKGLVSNFARKPQGGDTDQIKAIGAGEGDVAIANSYYYGRLQASTDPKNQEIIAKVGIFFPNQNDRGAHINISGGAVTKYAKHYDNAIKFIEFLSLAENQAIYAQKNYEYPIDENVELSAIVKSWPKFKADEDSLLKIPDNLAKAVVISDKAGWR